MTVECEFAVTQQSKCYLKNNIAGGTYGKTGASPTIDATCVKGAENWLKFALQVSNQPAGGAAGGLPGLAATPLPPRRNGTGPGNGAGARGGGGARAVGAAAVAGLGVWLLLALLVG